VIIDQHRDFHLTNKRQSWLRVISSPWIIFSVALLIRVADLLLRRGPQLNGLQNFANFGYEIGAVARSIALGQGFSSPFGIPTGPTAWYTPAYPLFIAAIFHLFGIYTASSVIAVGVLNSIFSALTCLAILGVCRRTVGWQVGLWAAWIWAVFPYFIQWPVRWIWDTSLSALLMAFIFYLTLRLEQSRSTVSFVGYGLAWGLIANTNPTLLALLPAALIWIYCQRARFPARTRLLTLSILVFLLTMLPWMIRNRVVMGYTGLRDNFGEELFLGNHEAGSGFEPTGFNMSWSHPVWNSRELERYRQEGELAYIAEKKQIAEQFIREHPGTFALVTLKRIVYFWSGSPEEPRVHPTDPRLRTAFLFTTAFFSFWGAVRTIRRSVPSAYLFLSVLSLYPLVFYITHTNPRYRHPIEPIMTILICYLFCSAAEEKSRMAKFWRRNRMIQPSAEELQAETLRK
jgi:4-amino-4-deoxy-L-arabinose transferase-like glycosyltransferase